MKTHCVLLIVVVGCFYLTSANNVVAQMGTCTDINLGFFATWQQANDACESANASPPYSSISCRKQFDSNSGVYTFSRIREYNVNGVPVRSENGPTCADLLNPVKSDRIAKAWQAYAYYNEGTCTDINLGVFDSPESAREACVAANEHPIYGAKSCGNPRHLGGGRYLYGVYREYIAASGIPVRTAVGPTCADSGPVREDREGRAWQAYYTMMCKNGFTFHQDGRCKAYCAEGTKWNRSAERCEALPQQETCETQTRNPIGFTRGHKYRSEFVLGAGNVDPFSVYYYYSSHRNHEKTSGSIISSAPSTGFLAAIHAPIDQSTYAAQFTDRGLPKSSGGFNSEVHNSTEIGKAASYL